MKKSGFPYLVDIKITEMCNFGCKFCYQSSTPNGNHAELGYLRDAAHSLMKYNVLEVNFGGGEPTIHPYIAEIINVFSNLNFCVALTTKNYKWHINDSLNCINSLNYLDSIAISVNSLKEIEAAKDLTDFIKKNFCQVHVYYQMVFGLYPYNQFLKIFKTALSNNNKLTLLGYKNFGFGKPIAPFEYPDSWIKEVKNEASKSYVSIGVDSVMVSKYNDLLIKSGVKESMLVGREGNSTCYLDAVKKTLHPSSFDETNTSFNFEPMSDNLYEIFAKL